MECELSKISGHSESESLELKESFSNEALETIGASANAKGRTLIVGVKNNGSIVDFTTGGNTLEEWAQKIQHKLHPRILTSISLKEHDGKTVGIITVPDSDVPVSVDGRINIRVGRTNQLRERKKRFEAAQE